MVLYSMIKSQLTPISQWNSDFIDSILIEGNEFYINLIHKLNIEIRYLGIDDLTGTHTVYENQFFVDSFEMYSNLTNDDPEVDQFIRNCHNGHINYDDLLIQSQTLLTSECKYGLFICNGYSYGLIKNQNIIYIFDSHAKDVNGNNSENGVASLRCFVNLNELVLFLLKINPVNEYYQVFYLSINEIDSNELACSLVNSMSTMSIDISNRN